MLCCVNEILFCKNYKKIAISVFGEKKIKNHETKLYFKILAYYCKPCLYIIMKRNFKQWCSTIPQISAKGPHIIKHTNTKTYSDGNPGPVLV